MNEHRTHYIYVIHNKNDGRYYIGSRSCVGDPQDDPYMGSSEKWSPIFKAEPDIWDKYVIQTYKTREEADAAEQEMLRDGHFGNSSCLNGNIGGRSFFRNREEARRLTKEYTNRPEYRQQNKERVTQKWKDDAFRINMIARQTAAQNRPDVKERRTKSMLETILTPEYKAWHSQQMKLAMNTPEYHAAQSSRCTANHKRAFLKKHTVEYLGQLSRALEHGRIDGSGFGGWSIAAKMFGVNPDKLKQLDRWGATEMLLLIAEHLQKTGETVNA